MGDHKARFGRINGKVLLRLTEERLEKLINGDFSDVIVISEAIKDLKLSHNQGRHLDPLLSWATLDWGTDGETLGQYPTQPVRPLRPILLLRLLRRPPEVHVLAKRLHSPDEGSNSLLLHSAGQASTGSPNGGR